MYLKEKTKEIWGWEKALFPLDLVEVEVVVASLTAELIMAGMVAETAASRASLIDEMTGLRF